MEGDVIWYDRLRRYGFVQGSDGQDYFLHQNELSIPSDEPRLRPKQRVTFEPHRASPNWKATEVRVISGAEPSPVPEAPIPLKANPFTPQDPVTDPRRFAGRREALRSAVDTLYNAGNILITGPRGIGKSSLAYQLLYMTEGDPELLYKLNIDADEPLFNYLTADHRCTADNDLIDIARGLAWSLARNVEYNEPAERTSHIGFDLKLLTGGVESKSRRASPSSIAAWFAGRVEDVFEADKEGRNGVAILIDEVDALEPGLPLGPFLKACSEKFRLDAHHSICFIVGGVTGTSTKLLQQHRSTERLLERINLERMSNAELDELITLALDGTSTIATDEARGIMVELANGFPQPLHRIGYHTFRFDDDNRIAKRDVEAAKRYLVERSLREDFEERLGAVGQGLARDIVRVAALAGQSTVSLNYCKKQLQGATEHAIQSQLGELVSTGVLERRGRYVWAFREPLFEIYCQWVFG